MELLADRDPEEARKILDPVLERMMEAVHHYEGTVNQVMGDGIMALFGAPLAHEDHAVRACYAALRMQESVKRYAEGVRHEEGITIRIRVGLNSGEVVVRAIGSDLRMDYTAVGQTTHLAARMEQLAEPGTALLTAATLALGEDFIQVKSLGPMRLKGLSEPVQVYELAGANPVRSRFQVHATRGLTKFVGRTSEIAQLADALDLARSGRGQIVAVVGEPGVGKSRLCWELAHSHRTDGCLVIDTASVSYGKATTYFPVIELLRGYFQIEPRDDIRKIREKVTGKMLSLDRTLEPALPALLALLDVPPRGRAVGPPRSASTAAAKPRRREAPSPARESRAAGRRDLRGPALDRRRDTSGAGRARGKPADGAHAVARQLPPRVPTRLERQDVLPAGATRRAADGDRGGAPPSASRERREPGAAQAAPDRADRGQSVLP